MAFKDFLTGYSIESELNEILGEDSPERWIIKQLGDAHLIERLGAFKFGKTPIVATKKPVVTFKIQGKSGFTKYGINYVEIECDSKKTKFEIRLYRIAAGSITHINTISDVKPEDLITTFQTETGTQILMPQIVITSK